MTTTTTIFLHIFAFVCPKITAIKIAIARERQSQKSRPDQKLSAISLKTICCKYLRKNYNGCTRIDDGRTNEQMERLYQWYLSPEI